MKVLRSLFYKFIYHFLLKISYKWKPPNSEFIDLMVREVRKVGGRATTVIEYSRRISFRKKNQTVGTKTQIKRAYDEFSKIRTRDCVV